jgi:hypothetical protein
MSESSSDPGPDPAAARPVSGTPDGVQNYGYAEPPGGVAPLGPNADPGRTLGIIGLVLAFVASIAGIIVSAIALRESRRAGYSNGFAIAGLILSIVFSVVGLIIAIFVVFGIIATLQQCAALGPGVHQLGNGLTFTCGR